MNSDSLNIMVGGEAGQGLVTIGRLLSLVLVRSGYRIVVTQSYQSRIRGGHNTFAVRVCPDKIQAPAEEVDLLVAMNAETTSLHRDELSTDGAILVDKKESVDDKRCILVPFDELAEKKYMNTAALGVLCAMLGVAPDAAVETIKEEIGHKHPESMDANKKAFDAGYDWCMNESPKTGLLPPPTNNEDRLMLNGNEAIALGAAAAGAKFCAFYPMTPATTIPLTLIRIADEMGIVVEQAEDEIAAINMALGASFAGAPSMVATSGGGFALMVEGLSLAAMTETPIVFAISQRPGPATGLPTRTEQADLEFVLNAGHGEFHRIIYAPGDIEESFTLARKAFETAERFQSPVFILTDQFLSDSYRAVEMFDLKGLEPVKPGGDPSTVSAPYKRYELTDEGISPRLIPGSSEHLVVADSDEHDETGHLTEDLSIRKLMVEKRLKKGELIAREIVAPSYVGDKTPDLLVISWGSSKGSALEAAEKLCSMGKKAAVLHFAQVWPLAPESFIGFMEKAKDVVMVEGNATGQFARIIKTVSGFDIEKMVLRYDGLPITPGYIVQGLKALGVIKG